MPVVADVPSLAAVLDAVVLDPPQSHRALTVVPLLASGWPEPGWLTLVDALPAFSVAEASEDGVVTMMTVTNKADRPLLLLDGEELLGAKQNRVLNTTVLVAARSTTWIPVSCVEQGRWDARARRFTPGGTTLYASLRAEKAAQVSRSLRTGAGHASDQGRIWRGLEARARARGVASATGAMHDVFATHEAEIAAARAALAPRPGQVGAVVYVAGRWVGLDLLGSPDLFARAWDRLAGGYVAEALVAAAPDTAPPTMSWAPDEVMRLVRRAEVEEQPAVGLGVEYRIVGRPVTGAALVADDRVAHLMAFPSMH
jgi:hypothetical protein